MITRCYLEITNVCNLNCVFCPKTMRPKHTMTMEQFDTLTTRLMGEVKFLYFHLMGEPFLHPLLPQFVLMAREKGFVPVITTNGTLMTQRADMLEALPHKLQISLHSHEGNGKANLGQYIDEVMAFAKEAARRGCVVVLRLWNEGGHNLMNETILRLMAEHQPRPWVERHDGWKLTDNLFLENDNMFEWPDLQHNPHAVEEVFCYALRNQIGVLVDGTVVPCCLDHDGDMGLGNLYGQSLDRIMASPRAQALYHGFTHHTAVEPLCRRCGYSAVSKQFRKQ
ncbi:MAG: SPASM domain-containing protein [Prevotella sp.]|nr:SPASM domain-containing protein [Prevotella sp.]MDY3283445.1 SPASM domain-containing protein [Prevotella sp.]